MKRIILAAFFVVVAAFGVLLPGDTVSAAIKTSPCDWHFSACGYYSAKSGANADCNVLPGSNQANYCQSWDQSILYTSNVNDATTFENVIINSYLGAPGTNSWALNANYGAAFIIDVMLGAPNMFNKNIGAGWSYSWNNQGTWKSRINALAVNSCLNSGSQTDFRCPGKTYGINWNFTPLFSNFCTSTRRLESGYSPTIPDPVVYPIYSGTANCTTAYNSSLPEIVFYWNNGANSIAIGKKCGNIQEATDALPATDSLPTGTIAVACTDKVSGKETFTVNFSDPDGATNGYVTINGTSYNSGTLSSGSSVSVVPTTVTPYAAQTAVLHILDSGPLAPPGTYVTVSTSTAGVLPCATLNCGNIATTPVLVDPFQKFSLAVSATTGSTGTAPSSATVNLTIPLQNGSVYSYSGSAAATVSGSAISATFSNLGAMGKSGTYNATYTVTASGLTIGPCTDTFPIVYLPYLKVYGGDAAIGMSPYVVSGAASCDSDSGAGGFSWNNDDVPNYTGAGVQYAVLALSQLNDFATAVGSANTPPAGLSFANYYSPANPSYLNPGAGLFGGNFGFGAVTTGDCDFTTDQSDATQKLTGATTIGGFTLNSGSDARYITGGDVYLSGDIKYATGIGWTNPSQIPLFKLVVLGGDIYINSAVKQLDGIFVAVPQNGVGGHIYTCASGPSTAVNLSALNNAYTTCNNQLVINGTFIAKVVHFGRTYGSVGQAATDTLALNHAGEVFNYTPEVWLPRKGASPADNSYTAITGLPPVL